MVIIAIPTCDSYYEGMKARVTSKGQVTIPKEIRDRFGIKPGTQVDFVSAEDGIRIRKVVDRNIQKNVLGCLKAEFENRSVGELLDELRGRVELPEDRSKVSVR